MENKKSILIILVVVAIGALIFIRGNKSNPNVQSQNLNYFDGTSKKVMAKMPAGLPVESNAPQVLGNATTTKEGISQNNIMFNSSKTITQNYAIYKKYCTDNGWQLTEPKTVSDSSYIVELTCAKGTSRVGVLLSTIPIVFPKVPTKKSQTSVVIKYLK